MLRGTTGFSAWGLFLVLFFCSGLVLGDGCFIPPRAFPTPPAIPSQRALVVFRDGVETLVIESSLDSEAQSFGWIIPVPSVPERFEKVSPGLLQTLTLNTGPKIINGRRNGGTLVTAGVLFCIFLVSLFAPRHRVLSLTFLVVLIGAWGVLFFMPTLGGGRGRTFSAAGGEDVLGVRVRNRVQVGSYELTVLESGSAGALSRWLGANDLSSIPVEGVPIVSDYVRQGWVFVAARLTREGTGFSVPHPLLMEFRTDKAVYPMRLTALAGSAMHLELYACAEKRAVARDMVPIHCDRLSAVAVPSGKVQTPFLGFHGLTFWRSIAHLGMKPLFWDGAVLTRLEADLTPEEMGGDVILSFCSFEPHERIRYSVRGALAVACLYAGRVCIVLLLVCIPLICRDRYRGVGRRWLRRRWALTCAVVGSVFLTGCCVYAFLPVIGTRSEERVGGAGNHAYYVVEIAKRFLRNRPELCAADPDSVARALCEHLESRGIGNPMEGGAVRVEDSPGNVTVSREGGVLCVAAYGIDGRAWELELE